MFGTQSPWESIGWLQDTYREVSCCTTDTQHRVFPGFCFAAVKVYRYFRSARIFRSDAQLMCSVFSISLLLSFKSRCKCRPCGMYACSLDCDEWPCAGMGVSCLQQLFVAFAGTKSLSIVAVACGSLANISFPAISSIKSKSVPRHEQVSAISCPCVLPWQNSQCILIWCQEATA